MKPKFCNRFVVQYELPCEKPEDNVRMTRGKRSYRFSVPINLPDAHSLGFVQLFHLAERGKLLGLSTPLNNRIDSSESTPIVSTTDASH